MLEAGGPVLLLLILMFTGGLIIIGERYLYYRGLTVRSEKLLSSLYDDKKNIIINLPEQSGPVVYVFTECIRSQEGRKHFSPEIFEEVKSRAIAEILPDAEKYFSSLATLASVSPFIGLLGTVLGIIRAFMSLGADPVAGQNAMAGLNAGIAEALITTAAGLLIAVPASVAFNYFRRQADLLVTDIETGISRLKILYMNRD